MSVPGNVSIDLFSSHGGVSALGQLASDAIFEHTQHRGTKGRDTLLGKATINNTAADDFYSKNVLQL